MAKASALALQAAFSVSEHRQPPLMKRFHKPGDEKRGVIVLPRAAWNDWLECREPEAARSFLRLYPADAMVAEPAPVPPRVKQVESTLATSPILGH